MGFGQVPTFHSRALQSNLERFNLRKVTPCQTENPFFLRKINQEKVKSKCDLNNNLRTYFSFFSNFMHKLNQI